VAWLASDAAGDVSGQVFIVIGGDVHLARGFGIVSSVHHDGAWPVEDLIAAKGTLFGDHKSGPGGFSGVA
jgi:hypothetical protein